jgi:hypothetical protein
MPLLGEMAVGGILELEVILGKKGTNKLQHEGKNSRDS